MPTPNLPKAPEPSAGSSGFSAWAKDLVAYLTGRFGAIADTISERALFSVRRIATPTGTALAAGNVSIVAGPQWGNTSTFVVSGNDQRGSVAVTSNGAGMAAQPTVVITFVDGPWRVVPFAVACRGDVVAPLGAVSTVCTTTTLTLTFHGTPAGGGAVYVLNWDLLG